MVFIMDEKSGAIKFIKNDKIASKESFRRYGNDFIMPYFGDLDITDRTFFIFRIYDISL